MKKVALTLAGVIAAAAFAPEASAIPAFARQTGMSCNACHYMKFPILNGFGRAFKANGYTMMGAQGKVEDEHLSIPDTLNAAILFKYRYQQTMGKTGGISTTTGEGQSKPTGTDNGQWQMADEFSLFLAGRVAETDHFNIGFLLENNQAAGPAAGLRVPVTTDLGVAKVSIVPFTTDALGVAYGFELSSGGVMRANRWAEMRRQTSAIQYNADRNADTNAYDLANGKDANNKKDNGAASGTAFVAHNDMGFVNFTKWSSSFAPGGNGGGVESTNFGQTYIRVAATPNIMGFDIVAGGGMMSGSSYSTVATQEIASEQTFLDAQAHGQVMGFDAGLYAQYADAAKTVGTVINTYNPSTAANRKALTIGGEVQVIPHALTVGAAYREARNGKAGGTGAENKDNAFTLLAVYDLTQNVALHANYAMYSGDVATKSGGLTSEFLGMLEAAW